MLQEPRFVVVCPTTGRATLCDVLDSVNRQELCDGDRVVIVNKDPPSAFVLSTWEKACLPGHLVGTSRNGLPTQFQDNYVLHLNEDDVFAPGAFKAIRRAVTRWPESLFIFRMVY